MGKKISKKRLEILRRWKKEAEELQQTKDKRGK
jgi:hypothetical protein